MKWLYYRFIYRPFMAIAHRAGWHYMRHHMIYPHDMSQPYQFLKCDWCGIHSDIPYSMRARKVEAMMKARAGGGDR